MTISVFPAIFFAIVIGCLVVLQDRQNLNLQIQDELAERRSKYARI